MMTITRIMMKAMMRPPKKRIKTKTMMIPKLPMMTMIRMKTIQRTHRRMTSSQRSSSRNRKLKPRSKVKRNRPAMVRIESSSRKATSKSLRRSRRTALLTVK